MRETLPRSLATVQFVRIVPLTGQGREAEFEQCPVVAVAVPSSRTPAPPTARIEVAPASGQATIVVAAPGFDLVALKQAEPGLFSTPPDPDARAPRYRIRRATGSAADPLYAREVAQGELVFGESDGAPGDGAPGFGARAADLSPLLPFVRYSYWVEACMPPERRLTPGVVETPPANGVTAVFAQQMMDAPRPFSAPSAPVTVLFVPPLPVPQLTDAVASIASAGGASHARLNASATPGADRRAVGRYRLRVWEQWGDRDIGPAREIDLNGGAIEWKGADAPDADRPRPLTLRYAVIDPVGRESAVVTLRADGA